MNSLKKIIIGGGLALVLLSMRKKSSVSVLDKSVLSINKSFGSISVTQLNGIAEIVKAFEIYGDNDLNKLAYILATAWHESLFRPVREGFAKTDAIARNILAGKNYLKYTNDKLTYLIPNNHAYYGRGLVQLTWFDNYKLLGNLLKIDLVNNPDLALQPDVAAKIMVIGMMKGLFTGKKLSDYISPNGFNDFYNARRIVNVLDKAQLINDYTITLINNA